MPPPEYDKRLPRAHAEALVRRRIGISDLRYRRHVYGLDPDASLAAHFDLVHLLVTLEPVRGGGRPYRVHQWGVRLNGHPAGYISTSYAGDRHKFLPYGYSPKDVVADTPAGATSPAT